MVHPHSLVHRGSVCIWKPNLLSVLGDHSNRRCEGQTSHHLSTAMTNGTDYVVYNSTSLQPLSTHTSVYMHCLLHCSSLSPWGHSHTSAPGGEKAQSSHTWQHIGGSWSGHPVCRHTCIQQKFNDVTSQVYPAMQSSESALTLSHVCTLSWCSSTNHVTSSMLPLMEAWCNMVRPFCRCKHMHTQSLHHMSCTHIQYVSTYICKVHLAPQFCQIQWVNIVCSLHSSPSGRSGACLQGAWPSPGVHTQRQQ